MLDFLEFDDDLTSSGAGREWECEPSIGVLLKHRYNYIVCNAAL